MKKIEDITVKMNSFGAYSPNDKQRKIFYPDIKVKYVGSKKKHSICIEQLIGRFKVGDLKSVAIIGDYYFILLFKIEWDIISSDGVLVKSMGPCGQIVGSDENSFTVRHHGVLTGYNIKGEILGERMLTPEEIAMCDEEFGKEIDE